MFHLGLIVCAKLKVKVSVNFVTSLISFILNIVSAKLYHKNENRHFDFDSFDLQEEVGQSFYILTIFILSF